MKRKIKVGVSNRHVHLTEEAYNQLFFHPITKKKDLSQIGDFAANQTVALQTKKEIIDSVRVIGPFRNYNQVEISKSDARKLGLNPPIRKSGDLSGSEKITLIGEKGTLTLHEACIIAERHVHMNNKEAEQLGIVDGEKVKVEISGDKSGIMDAYIKVSENGVLAFHIDIDDANAFDLSNDDEVDILL